MSSVEGRDDGVGHGVYGYSFYKDGVKGYSYNGRAVFGESGDSGDGVVGSSNSGDGVVGRTNGFGKSGVYASNNGIDFGFGVYASSKYGEGVHGVGGIAGVRGESGSGLGVHGISSKGVGVRGQSVSYYGVHGISGDSDGVHGEGAIGVFGKSDAIGVAGMSPNGIGVIGGSNSSHAVIGNSNVGYGMYGTSNTNNAVHGESGSGDGVHGESGSGYGVYGGSRSGYGVYGYSSSSSGYAAYLDGRVYIRGPLEKPGGQFKIDHPLDPANKYLNHSFVESPDMKNIYDGVVALDNKGEAEIELPDWFGALNKDFRYQLTAIGAPGPNLYIAEEISDGVTNYSNNSGNNRFKIAGGTPGMKVSWNITGIRKDPWADAHRIQVEEDKPDKERGYYIYPDLYGQPAENGISRLPFPEEQQKLLINENKRPKRKAPAGHQL